MNESPAQEFAELLGDSSSLSRPEVNERVRVLWPLLHGPLHTFEQAAVVELFKQAGYVSDDVPCPAGELTIYRGALIPAGPSPHGLSWSRSQDVATWYARGYSTVGATEVLKATAPAGAVLAQFSADDEVLVEPGLLREAVRLGVFPRFTGLR